MGVIKVGLKGLCSLIHDSTFPGSGDRNIAPWKVGRSFTFANLEIKEPRVNHAGLFN